MPFDTFQQAIQEGFQPPSALSLPLQALWLAQQGKWEAAHQRAQQASNQEGHWVHAYLHRQEGSLDNATYWYHQAEKPFSTLPLQEEWEQIAKELLTSPPLNT